MSSPEHVADRLHSASIHLLRRARRRDPEAAIGPAGLSALSVLVFRGPATLGELAREEQVRPPTMTNIVNRLEAAGLVRKEAGSDRRSILVTATPAGERLLQDARRRRISELAGLLRDLPESELELLDGAAELIERTLSSSSRPK